MRLDKGTKSTVSRVLKNYPRLVKELEIYKTDLIPSATPKYSENISGSGGESRPSENIVLRIENDLYVIATERKIRAVEYVLSQCDELDLKLIKLAYWTKGVNITGVAMQLNMSKSAAYKHLEAVLTELAKQLGEIP